MPRIISGTAGGLRLKVPKDEKIRPTLDRVKESVFAILTPVLQGAGVLDLFSGSGALGIEALSRGADSCVFCDSNPKCCEVIKANLVWSGLDEKAKILRCDAFNAIRLMAAEKRRFDLLLLDPPYGESLVLQILCIASEYDIMTKNALAVAEHSCDETLPEKAGDFHRFREEIYGGIRVSIYQKSESANEYLHLSGKF